MTKKISLAAALFGATMLAGVAQAQTATDASFTPLKAGTFLAHFRVIDVAPLDSSSSISKINGSVDVSNEFAPELDLSYFFTDNIALEAIAASTDHTIKAKNTALGNLKVGDVWVLPPSITLKYYPMPANRFSPYVGAGLDVAFFYSSEAASPLKRLSLTNNAGPVLQAGFDYSVSGPWSINFDVKQIFLNTTASINSNFIKAKVALDPTVIGLGVGYRF
jgi:outer membrane protein